MQRLNISKKSIKLIYKYLGRIRTMTYCTEHLQDVWIKGYTVWFTGPNNTLVSMLRFFCVLFCVVFLLVLNFVLEVEGVTRTERGHDQRGRWVGPECMIWNLRRINKKLLKKETIQTVENSCKYCQTCQLSRKWAHILSMCFI